MGRQNGGERRVGAVHEIGPGAAVNVQIDEARHDVAVAGVDHQSRVWGQRRARRARFDRDDPPGSGGHRSAGQHPVLQHDLAAKNRRHACPVKGLFAR